MRSHCICETMQGGVLASLRAVLHRIASDVHAEASDRSSCRTDHDDPGEVSLRVRATVYLVVAAAGDHPGCVQETIALSGCWVSVAFHLVGPGRTECEGVERSAAVLSYSRNASLLSAADDSGTTTAVLRAVVTNGLRMNSAT